MHAQDGPADSPARRLPHTHKSAHGAWAAMKPLDEAELRAWEDRGFVVRRQALSEAEARYLGGMAEALSLLREEGVASSTLHKDGVPIR